MSLLQELQQFKQNLLGSENTLPFNKKVYGDRCQLNGKKFRINKEVVVKQTKRGFLLVYKNGKELDLPEASVALAVAADITADLVTVQGHEFACFTANVRDRFIPKNVLIECGLNGIRIK